MCRMQLTSVGGPLCDTSSISVVADGGSYDRPAQDTKLLDLSF